MSRLGGGPLRFGYDELQGLHLVLGALQFGLGEFLGDFLLHLRGGRVGGNRRVCDVCVCVLVCVGASVCV